MDPKKVSLIVYTWLPWKEASTCPVRAVLSRLLVSGGLIARETLRWFQLLGPPSPSPSRCGPHGCYLWGSMCPFHPHWLPKSTSCLLHPEHHLRLQSLPPITSMFTLPGPQSPAFRVTGIADPMFGLHIR